MNKPKDLRHNVKTLLNYKFLILLAVCLLPMVSAAQTWNLHFSDGTVTINATDICVADGSCLTDSSAGDITAVSTDGPYLFGGATSGAVSLLFNSSALNLTINDISVGNLSWNETYSDTLYAGIGVTGDNRSWNETLADALYADIGVVNTDTQDLSYNTTTNIISLVDGGNIKISEINTNTVYSHLSNFTDDIGVNSDWDELSDVPTATPSDNDTTHLSTADQIYDWVVSLTYATQSWVTTQLSSYSTTAVADTLYADISITGDNSSWNEVRADGLYAILGYGDNWNKTYADGLYADISVTGDNSSWNEVRADGLYYEISNPSVFYNASDFEISSYVPYTGASSNLVFGANNFSVNTNSFFVNKENGFVGIGTINPQRPIHMVGNGSSDTGWARFGLSTTEYTEIGHRGYNSAINAVGDGDLDFRHDGSNVMELSDTGNLNVIGNVTSIYFLGNGSQLTDTGVNLSWNEVRADTLYADISVTGDNSSWSEIRANGLYAILGYGDDWSKTYADNLYGSINLTTDNSSWNEVRADTLYRTSLWNNFTGIPTATPSNGDTTHLSTANQIYDWAVGIFLTAMDYTNIAMTNSSETFESNVTVEELVFETAVTNSIRDNATCVIIGGATSQFEIC